MLGAGNAFPKTPARLTRPDLLPPGTRTLNILDIGRHLERDDIDPPLRALFIYNHNPIVVHPDQNRLRRGLQREDMFTVGIEITMTESMQHCDMVLPAATHFEYDDIYGAYGHQWLQRAEPVIPPLGECVAQHRDLPPPRRKLRLRRRLLQAPTTATLMDEALDLADPRLRGHRPATLPASEALRMATEDGRPLALFDTVMPATPSGKVELVSETLAASWGARRACRPFGRARAGFPLSLISPASDKRISSTLLGAGGAAGEAPPLLMHPPDAAGAGLAAGAEVRVWNELGVVILRLRVTDAVPPGVVSSEKGAWLATSRTAQTISALVSAEARADLAEGACFNDTRVEVAAA